MFCLVPSLVPINPFETSSQFLNLKITVVFECLTLIKFENMVFTSSYDYL